MTRISLYLLRLTVAKKAVLSLARDHDPYQFAVSSGSAPWQMIDSIILSEPQPRTQVLWGQPAVDQQRRAPQTGINAVPEEPNTGIGRVGTGLIWPITVREGS